MPITSFTIGGVEVNPLWDGFEIRESAGNISTLTCKVESIGSPVQRPTVFQTVVVKEDDEVIFSGTIMQARESGFGGPNIYDADSGAPQIVTEITAMDWERLGERITVSLEIAAGTSLEDALTALVAEMADVNVTLHPSQDTGPTLPQMSFANVRAAEVLRAFSEATGWDRRIDYEKQIRMWEPGTIPAPAPLDQIDEFDEPAKWTGDVEVETILGDDYANRVRVIVDLPEEKGHVESFEGDGVTDTIQLAYTLTAFHAGVIHIYESDGVTPAGGETFGIPPDAPLQWEYDSVTNSATRVIGPMEADKIYRLTFDGVLQLEAMAEDAVAIADPDIGLYEHVEFNPPGITSQQAADDLAAAILAARLDAGEQSVTYSTRAVVPTLHVGQTQTLTATARGVSGDYIITYLRVIAETPSNADFAAAGLGLLRTVTAKRNTLTGRHEDTYRDWLRFGRGGGGGTSVIGDGGPSGAGPAPPIYSNQWHHPNGGFGGSESWTFDPDTRTAMIGTGHTPGGQHNFLNGSGHTVN